MFRAGNNVCAALITGAIMWLGCSSPQVNMGRGTRSFQPYDYQEVFNTWSREFQILPVDGIENILTARGTYLSREFRAAYVARVAYDLRLSPAERQDLHDQQHSAGNESHEFFITLMSGVSKIDDLDPEKGTWHIRLEDDSGRQVAPTSIQEIKKPSVSETKYFGFDKAHRKAYRIFFPLAADDGSPLFTESTRFFSLAFSSALGQGTMQWETTVSGKEE
ncbi:MAG: hypothetical protein GY854_22700 [Deltaproteobacteria bacterium]|nr:hypothetical protein [Deltaproteobacteria bacterium]